MVGKHHRIAIAITFCLITTLCIYQLFYDQGVDKKIENYQNLTLQSNAMKIINRVFNKKPPKKRVHIKGYDIQEGSDKANDSGALVYIKASGKRHGSKVSDDLDPNDPTKVTTWWQAAALISWYLTGELRHSCQKKKWFGNKLICQDRNWRVSPPCLVYSFGINYDFSFDDAMATLGCEVHAFDPSMNQSDHKRPSGVTFHKMGLSDADTDSYEPRSDGYVNNARHTVRWRMRTLGSVMNMLGHSGKILDVLKLDIEASEWAVARQVMSSDILRSVKQMNIEWHIFRGGIMGFFPPLEDYIPAYRTIRALRSLGWREVSSSACCYPNYSGLLSDVANLQSEIAYVNYYFEPR